MSIYSSVESGTSWVRSRFTKSISYGIQYDAQFGKLVPVLRKFCLPGDVWRIGGQCLVRLQPMVSPPMNRMIFKIRYFFIPLRLVEDNAELVITGSRDGHLYNGTLPALNNIFTNADTNKTADAYKITKHTLLDYFGCQTGDYTNFSTDECLPAQYWPKSYLRCIWDYYDDENIGYLHQTYTDFDAYMTDAMKYGGQIGIESVSLPKDYFTSSLPWQLKGVAPVIQVGTIGSFTPNYNGNFIDHVDSITGYHIAANALTAYPPFRTTNPDSSEVNRKINELLNQPQTVNITQLGFTTADERIMNAQTRIFERAARCGSRYTEYLRSNFGTAPADDTLQRAQYLGGWKLPIVTTEVLQTAPGTDPVGTMRGHGITNGGNTINTFHCKEFGIILGLAHVLPEIKYSTGCPREMSYKRRFEFFNPSFQHLSEQEVRNGELWIGSDGKNDDTFGFQAYANELRTSQNIVVGDMRGSLNYWNQCIDFNSRPNLNYGFIGSSNHLANFNKPFAVSGSDAYPLIIDFYNNLDVYRPMVRYATPGLTDHL